MSAYDPKRTFVDSRWFVRLLIDPTVTGRHLGDPFFAGDLTIKE
jgi:hypothetical protein